MANLPHFKPPLLPETSPGQYFAPGARPQAVPVQSVPVSAAAMALKAAIARLEAVLDEETASLEQHQRLDLADINQKKSQSLLELTRLARQFPAGSDAQLRPQLEQVRQKLDRNLAIVGLNLRAVREIAVLVTDLLGEADSDGTYTAPRPRVKATT